MGRSTTGSSRPNETMSVAYVFPGGADGIGGSESQALVFFQTLDEPGVDVSLVILGDNPTFAAAVAERTGIVIERLGPAGADCLRPEILVRYWRLLMRRRHDVVHLFGLRQELATRLLSRLAGVPVVISGIRGLESHRSHWQCRLNRWTGRWVDLWISNSEQVRGVFLARDGLPADRVIVVPNGVPVPDRPPDRQRARRRLAAACSLDPERLLVGCVANLLPHKRQEDLLAAMTLLQGEGVDCDLVLVGRREGHAVFIEREVARLGMAERVHLLGYRSDVRDLLPALDVFALASEKEGLPAAILEAMAAAVPVVTTAVAEAPHVVADGETGYVVPVGDPARIAEAIARLARDRDGRQRMGLAGMERARRLYSDRRLAARLVGIYREQLSRSSRSGRGRPS